MRIYYFFMGLIMVYLLTGCQVVPSVNINEISMVQGLGFDKAEGNKMLGTILFPEYKMNESSTIRVLKAEGETARKIIDKSKNEVEYPLVNGQLRTVLFGREMAEEGIYPLIDTFGRSPSIGNLVQLAVVDGKATELLSMKTESEANIPLYLQEMLEQNIEDGELPSSDYTVFTYNFYDDGTDPYLPLIKKVKDNIKINGLAVFDKDQLKITLPVNDMFIFKIIKEKFIMGAHQFKLNNDEFVVISNVKASPKYKVTVKDSIPEFLIQVKMNARVLEYTSKKHTTVVPRVKKFEKEITKSIERDAERIIKTFQENRVDPLGLGAQYEAHYRNFTLKKWEEMYPDVSVNVQVKLNIVHTGIVE
ncbi:Ger(x)C family spore germination protein [Fictibacillus halophilus]|uniref:Ger(x)C family spore germination protein n=1 Tax=Fictibacillus halophilus TaxID=1610490 RepID=UPI00362C2C63